ncbi:MAG: histidine kinase [Bacteroidota bacterium]
MNSEIVNVDEIEEIIIAYANGDLSRRLEISDNRDDRDTIIAGINMLGEELEKTMISRDYFMNIYNSVSEILIITDLSGKIIDLNLATELFFNKKLPDLKNINIRQLISTRFQSLRNLKPFNTDLPNATFDAALIIDDKKEVPISGNLNKIVDRFGLHKGYLFVARDITELKNRESNDLRIAISTQEKERRRLANDLHDSLGQEINAIKLYMNSLSVMDTSSDLFKETFETCKSIVDTSIETIRNISFDLLPKALENGGLVQALSELVKRLQPLCKISYNFPEFELTIDIDSQINIYRVVQEFINNSLKHAKGSTIEMQLTFELNVIALSINDNGKGFEMKALNYGNGLHNIKTRLKALNATYVFVSKINKGTRIELSIKESQ